MARLVLIAVAALAAVAVGGIAIYQLVMQADKSTAGIVKKDAKRLTLALVQHDTSYTPQDGEDWVPGVWAVFKRVDSGSVVKVWKRPHTGSNARSSGSDWVADILLQTGRGPVLLELAFRSPSFSDGDQQPDVLYELSPDRIPPGLFDAGMLARLASAQRERGPKIADDLVFSLAAQNGGDPAEPKPTPPTPTPAPAPHPRPVVPRPKLPAVIRCIRRVRPDVQKIQQCVRRYPVG